MCRFCQGLEDFCTQSELETLSFASKRMFWDCRDRIGKVRGAGGSEAQAAGQETL